MRTRTYQLVFWLSLLLLSACGGGGGGGSAPPPVSPTPPPANPDAPLVFTAGNTDAALRPVFPAFDTLLSRVNAVGAVLRELQKTRLLTLSANCSGSGTLTANVGDNGDNELSGGDFIDIEYVDCSDDYFNTPFSAELRIDLQGLATAALGELQIQGTFTQGSLVYDFAYQSTVRGETVVARSSPLATAVDLQGLTISDFDIRRDTQSSELLTSLQNGLIAITVSATIRNAGASGTYDCETIQPFATSNVLEAGELICTGGSNTAARLIVDRNNVSPVELQLSTNAGQAFSRVDGISPTEIFSTYLLETFTGDTFDFNLALPTLPTVSVNLPTKVVVSVPNADYVLALTPATAPVNASSLVAISLANGDIENAIDFVAEPQRVAVSQDGTTALVTFQDESVVRRIDLASFSVVETITIPDDVQDGALFGRDITISPTDSDVFAVALWQPAAGNNLERFSKTALFRNGAQQPQALDSIESVNIVRFTSNPSVIIGGNVEDTGFQISVVDVVADGLTIRDQLNGYSTLVLPFILSDDTVFTTDGQVIDPLTETLLGEFVTRFDRSPIRFAVAADGPNNRVYFYDTVLESYELDSNLPLASYDLGTAGEPHSLVNASADALVLGTEQEIAIISKAAIQPFDNLPCNAIDREDFATASTFSMLPCAFNDIVFSASTGRLYALLSSVNGADGNTVVEINPDTLAIERSLFVGPEPTHVGVSDGGTSLYVGVEGTGELLWIDLASFDILQRTGLPVDPFEGPLRGGEVQFVPGSETDAAVVLRARQLTVQYDRLVLFQSGVQAVADTSDTFFGENALDIDFGDSAQFVYGFDSETTARSFSRYEVSSSGIINPTSTGIGVGEAFGQMRYANGKFVISTGDVIDEATLSLEAPFEINDAPSVGFSQLLETESGSNSALFYFDFRESDTHRVIERYDLDSKALTGTARMPRFGVGFGRPSKLVSISNGRFALLFGDNLILVEDVHFE